MKQRGLTLPARRMAANSPRNCYGTAIENKQMRVKWRSKVDSDASVYGLEEVSWQVKTGLNLTE